METGNGGCNISCNISLEEIAVDSEYDPGRYGFHHIEKKGAFFNCFQLTISETSLRKRQKLKRMDES